MTNKKKKGFTIVELVIVIAVIAVLAAVLIPTFTGVIDKANESAALQEVQNAYIDALAQALGSKLEGESFTSENGFTFTFSDETGQNATISGVDGYPNAQIVNGVVVLGAAGEGDGGTVLTSENLATAFAEGGNYKLPEGGLTISSALELPAGVELTIDLNGNTLMVNDPSTADDPYYPITVLGTLNIVDSSTDSVENAGTISINEARQDNEYAYYGCCGICVGEPNAAPIGTLNLDGVNIVGKRMYNIENYGTASLTNTNFTVNSGVGFYDAGISTIKGGSFVANGEDVCPVQCWGGDVTITKTTTGTGTTFSEGDNFVSYYDNKAPIYVYNGTATLNGVTVTLKDATISAAQTAGTELCCVYAASSGTVTIESGTFNYLLGCTHDGYASITIQDGEINGIACADIKNDSPIVIAGNLTLTKDTENNCWVIS